MLTKKLSYNSQLTGLIIGLLLPILVMFLFYEFRNMQSFDMFINLVKKAGILTHLISLCVVPNLLVFFIFMWTNRLFSAKGIIGATFIYTFIVLIMKFF
ncbi:MAG: hypothetical protein L3J74_02390 [Bacteroidales bacterium]|nr:hypothetical protein [Bacteroidales bacterium]